MALATFGALLKFVIGLESVAIKFYEDAARDEKYATAKETFLAFAKEGRRRKELLEKTRQENVTEMILEPITDLKRSDYLTEIKLTPEMSYLDTLRLSIEVEENARKFYLDSASKARFLLAEVGRDFEKLARENAARKLKLQSLEDKATAQH